MDAAGVTGAEKPTTGVDNSNPSPYLSGEHSLIGCGASGKVRQQVTQESLGLSELQKCLIQEAISPNVTTLPSQSSPIPLLYIQCMKIHNLPPQSMCLDLIAYSKMERSGLVKRVSI